MQYKTIVLQLLRQRRELHHELRSSRQLLPTMERLAIALKNSHEALKTSLIQAMPGRDPYQSASEALEIAVQELEACLPSESHSSDENGPLSLEGAMAFIRRHSLPA